MVHPEALPLGALPLGGIKKLSYTYYYIEIMFIKNCLTLQKKKMRNFTYNCIKILYKFAAEKKV